MSLYDRAYNDIATITSNTNEWGTAIQLTNLVGESCNITGTRSKHHLGVDNMGNSVNTKNAHISFHESQVISQGFTIRDGNGDVAIKGFTATLEDSTGNNSNYVIKEFYPSETVGLIVCILGSIE